MRAWRMNAGYLYRKWAVIDNKAIRLRGTITWLCPAQFQDHLTLQWNRATSDLTHVVQRQLP
jgi:hypothetical protein